MGTSAKPGAPIRLTIRDALIRAAQEILIEQGREVSVLTIAERAGVSTGSFYNNFDSKDALFLEATAAAIHEFQVFMHEAAQLASTRLEAFTQDMRLYGRMTETHPHIAKLLVRTAPETLARGQGYNPDAMERVQALLANGDFKTDDPELAMLIAFAAFERLLAVRLQHPEIGSERADDLAFQMLILAGVPRAKARRLVSAPLPTYDAWTGSFSW